VQRERKRINVEPGRSVTTADSSSPDEGEDAPNDNECSEKENPSVEAKEVGIFATRARTFRAPMNLKLLLCNKVTALLTVLKKN
jgi:hypothetical protein